jgi:hypothetical protein
MDFATLPPESRVTNLQFALLLRDGFADSEDLLGEVMVKGATEVGRRKDSSGIFLFFDLAPGPQALTVTSGRGTPYYLPLSVAVTIPPPPLPASTWPAFPDIALADPALPLGDPGQPAAYRTQRQAATLWPGAAYPFAENATLIRGRVAHAGQPLAAATVGLVGSADPPFTTGADGQYVLFWRDAPGLPHPVTLHATHVGFPAVDVNVTVLRGLTVSAAIDL